MYPTYVVYADIIFLINFLLDLTILWATSRFGHLRTTLVRLVLGAAAGSIYGVIMVFPRTAAFYSVSMKILFSLFIVAVSFPKLTLKKFFQAAAYFYLISFVMAGAVLGGSSILSENRFLFQEIRVGGKGLIFAAGTALVLGMWGIKHLKRNWRKEQFHVPVQISVGEVSLMVEALIDTGNDLKDPLSQKPVIIIEYQSIKKILPEDFKRQFERYSATDVTRIVEQLEDRSWSTRIRVIPFSSIGKHHGMLIGFKPDLVVIFGERKISTKDVVVCLYHKPLSSGGNYTAIMNPEVLEAAA